MLNAIAPNLMPLFSKTILHFASEAEANLASAILSEIEGFEATPLTLREDERGWTVEVYDNGALAQGGGDGLLSMLHAAGVSLAAPPLVEALPDADWVTLTQQSLPPVRAGRFLVHGSHDRAAARGSRWAIEIDAGRAFGTAHHASTRGCLLAIDALMRGFTPKTALDLGAGSGVLAIAALKAADRRCRIVAADIDPIAVEVARKNCLRNGAASRMAFQVGDGTRPPLSHAAFDLVTANILAKPLIALAPRIHAAVRKGGYVILSGLLATQAREVAAAYAARGFRKVRLLTLDGWTTATLQRTS